MRHLSCDTCWKSLPAIGDLLDDQRAVAFSTSETIREKERSQRSEQRMTRAALQRCQCFDSPLSTSQDASSMGCFERRFAEPFPATGMLWHCSDGLIFDFILVQNGVDLAEPLRATVGNSLFASKRKRPA